MPLVVSCDMELPPGTAPYPNSSQDNAFANPEETQAGSAHFGGPYKQRYLNGLWRDYCFVLDARGPRPRRVPYCSLYSPGGVSERGCWIPWWTDVHRETPACEPRKHAHPPAPPMPWCMWGFTRGPTSAVSRTVYKLAAMQLAAEPRFATQPPLAAHAHSAFFFGASAFLPKRSSMTE